MTICVPCSEERNQYEDDIVSALKEWLELVTCVPWIRAYSDGTRPDENETNYKSGQYGTICVDSIVSHWSTKDEIGDVGEEEVCVVATNRLDVDVTLTVFGTHAFGDGVGTRLRQPSDILLRAGDIYHLIPNISEILRLQNSIVLNNFGRINNSETKIQTNYQRRASQVIELCVERKTSFADCKISGFQLEANFITNEEDTLEVSDGN